MHIEKPEVTELVDRVRLERPYCYNCGDECKTMGKGQGFRCRKCKARLPKTSRVQKPEPRKITTGVYLPPPRAHRHLTKPSSRYGIHRPASSETSNRNIDPTLESLVPISTAS